MIPATVGALSFSKTNNSLITNIEVQKEFWIQALCKEHPELDRGLVEREVDLEISMTTEGILRYERQTQKAVEQENESNTDYGRFLLRYKVSEIADEINALLINVREGKPGFRSSNLKLVKDMPPRTLAFLALRVLLDFISQTKSLHTIALEVGTQIETEARLNTFKAIAPKDFGFAMKRAARRPQLYNKRNSLYMIMSKKAKGEYDEGEEHPELAWTAWKNDDKLGIGLKILNVVMNVTGIAEAKLMKGTSKHGTYHVVPTAQYCDWVRDAREAAALAAPTRLPTIIPPKDYTTVDDGGYHTLLLPKTKLIKSNDSAYTDCLKDYDLSTITSAINTAQRTPWRVNTRILEVLQYMWDHELDFGVLPPQHDLPLPLCPKCGLPIERLNEDGSNEHPCFKDPAVLQRWKRAAVIVHNKNNKNFSKRLQSHRIVWAAKKMSEYDWFFFPYQLDFRGRLYAVPQFLSPQGCDTSKGLLEFADPMPINDDTARAWLAIHVANTWGEDKASFDDRIKWTEENTEMIRRIASDPIEHREWKDADSPFCFLAACFEWAGFIKEGFGYQSRIAVAQDGTCSGLQHYSAILRDTTGGKAVNLIPSERPQDIYAVVAARTLEKLEAVKESSEHYHTAQQWLQSGLVTRKLTKRSVMTLPYGSTLFSCKTYVREHVEEMRGKLGVNIPWQYDETQPACNYIGNLIWASIKETVVAAVSAMDWLRQVAGVCLDAELPVTWTTPTGLPVVQTYREMKERLVQTHLSGAMFISTGKKKKEIDINSKQKITLTLKEETDGLDRNRQVSGLAPNFIHSLDASALVFAVNMAHAEGINSFALIHDSFGTHAAKSAHLAKALREAFVDMYERHDVLQELRDEIESILPEDKKELLPEVPPKGDLDLHEVLLSPYFFA